MLFYNAHTFLPFPYVFFFVLISLASSYFHYCHLLDVFNVYFGKHAPCEVSSLILYVIIVVVPQPATREDSKIPVVPIDVCLKKVKIEFN